MRMLIWIVMALIVLLATHATAEQKGKGRAPCESLKTYEICNTTSGCAWVPVGKNKDGAVHKCRTLKAMPR